MKETINFNGFADAFRDYFNGDYKNNFSYDGLKALYDYIEQYEEDCEQEVELDVIALCCEYTEYEDLEEFLGEYNDTLTIDKEDYKDDEEGYKDACMEELRDHTQVIEIEGKDSFIIQMANKHDKLRKILIKYEVEEYGDSIIDEICKLFNYKKTGEVE